MLRSVELEETIYSLFDLAPFDSSDRISCSRTMCSISLEHAHSLKILIGSSNFTSAISLARLQYESLVRGMWVLYSASDIAVSKLSSDLTHESERKANKLPMLSEMIKQLEGKAPKPAVDMINEFKLYSWKSLSSYVHGGIHAVSRNNKGYPLDLITQVLKMSNAISTMAGMLLAILSGDSYIAGTVSKIQTEFKDCLPELKH